MRSSSSRATTKALILVSSIASTLSSDLLEYRGGTLCEAVEIELLSETPRGLLPEQETLVLALQERFDCSRQTRGIIGRDQTAGMGEARGYGWQLRPADLLAPFNEGAYGHTGFTGTSLVVDPRRDLVVVLLTNRVYAGRTHEGIDELRGELHAIVAEAVPPVHGVP